MPIIMLPNTNTHNLTQVTHRLIIVFVLLCTLIYNKQIICFSAWTAEARVSGSSDPQFSSDGSRHVV